MKTKDAVKIKMIEMIHDGKDFMDFLNETNANLGFKNGDKTIPIPKTYLRIWWKECLETSR